MIFLQNNLDSEIFYLSEVMLVEKNTKKFDESINIYFERHPN